MDGPYYYPGYMKIALICSSSPVTFFRLPSGPETGLISEWTTASSMSANMSKSFKQILVIGHKEKDKFPDVNKLNFNFDASRPLPGPFTHLQ